LLIAHATFVYDCKVLVGALKYGEGCVETIDEGGGLSFDKAAYEGEAAAGPRCSSCNKALGEQYWQWLAKPVCESCRANIMQTLKASQSKQAFGRAVLLGGLTSLGCGIAYAIFVGLTDIQAALVTIGIAFVVAKVLRRCSNGIGGRKYQVLAVVLTDAASAMGYAPALFNGMRESSAESAPANGSDASKTAKVPEAAMSSKADQEGASLGSIVLALGALFAFLLAAPILAATEAPLGLLIVGFGLWEAWKLTHGLPLELEGPFRVVAAAPLASAVELPAAAS
jgi:hypothetical protein